MAKKFSVSFDVAAKLINGKPMTNDDASEVKLGGVLADHIAGAAAEKNVIKLYSWASSMAKAEPVELDSEDMASLKAFIELLPRMPVFLKAQCLELLNDAKPAV